MNSKQLINNSAIGVIQLIITAIITLISVPIFINKLGLELYGVFAVVSVIGNLNLLANFGLNGALLVYIAKQGKCKESDYDIIVTQIILGIMVFTLIVIGFLFKEQILRDLLAIPFHYFADAIKLFIYLLIASALLLLGQSFSAVIDAQQKIYLTNISQFIYSLIYWGGLILVVSLGGGLVSIGLVALGAAVIWFILSYLIFFHLWGKLNLNGLGKHFKRVACKQIKYGSKIYISGLVGFMFEPLSKILLSNYIGLNAVALFEIGSKVRGQINGVITKAIYPIYPYIASVKSSDLFRQRIYDFSKKLQLFVLPLCIILIFTMTILLKLWLGPTYLDQTAIFVITMSASLLFLLPPVLLIYQYLTAKGLAVKTIWIQLISTISNIIIFFAILPKFGLYSILFSNTLAYCCSFLLCNFYQYKYLNANFWNERQFYGKIILYGIICTSICIFIRWFIPVCLLDLIIYPVLVGISFILFVRMQKLITNNDLELYFGNIPLLKKYLNRTFIS
jgi:O-antigen/teichoic acid export membrane protein